MGVTLAPGISHRPASSSENIIQPVVDAMGLTLRPFSNAQTSPVFQVQNVDGTAVHFGLNPDGEIALSAGVGTNGQVLTSAGAGNPVAWATPAIPDFSTVPLLSPNSASRNLIQPTADANRGLVIQEHSATQSAALLELRDNTGTAFFGAGRATNLWAVLDPTQALNFSAASNQTGVPFVFTCQTLPGTGSAAIIQMRKNANLRFLLDTNVAGDTEGVAWLVPGFLDTTSATYKGRLVFQAEDFNDVRECIRIEADGSAARIGLLGATAVARQTNGTAAQLAAILDPNVKAFLTALSNGVVNFGLFAAPA